MSAHTPGPWTCGSDGISGCYFIPEVPTGDSPHGLGVLNENDARLIAAAPDLYDALREVSMLIESGLFKHYEKEPWIDRVRAALTKVEKTP